jgi:phosphatidylserine synthase
MNTHNFFLGLAAAAALLNVVASILVMAALDRRGFKTNILWVRFLIFKYVSAYKKATIRETGRPGLLFYLWIGSINIAALAALLAVLKA